VLIALVILAIALLALAGLMVQSTNSNSWGSHLTEASTFAQDKLEQLRMTRWVNLDTDTDGKTGATGTLYTRAWITTTNATNDLKTVRITVSWTDKTNHTITILSVIAP